MLYAIYLWRTWELCGFVYTDMRLPLVQDARVPIHQNYTSFLSFSLFSGGEKGGKRKCWRRTNVFPPYQTSGKKRDQNFLKSRFLLKFCWNVEDDEVIVTMYKKKKKSILIYPMSTFSLLSLLWIVYFHLSGWFTEMFIFVFSDVTVDFIIDIYWHRMLPSIKVMLVPLTVRIQFCCLKCVCLIWCGFLGGVWPSHPSPSSFLTLLPAPLSRETEGCVRTEGEIFSHFAERAFSMINISISHIQVWTVYTLDSVKLKRLLGQPRSASEAKKMTIRQNR